MGEDEIEGKRNSAYVCVERASLRFCANRERGLGA